MDLLHCLLKLELIVAENNKLFTRVIVSGSLAPPLWGGIGFRFSADGWWGREAILAEKNESTAFSPASAKVAGTAIEKCGAAADVSRMGRIKDAG